MKIAFILPSLSNKGPVIVVYNLINILINDKRVSIKVFYFDDVESPIDFKCEVTKINFNEKIEFDKFDIIHSHTLRADLYVFRFRKNISAAKIVTTIHQDSFHTFRTKYNLLISKIITIIWVLIQKRFDAIIAISSEINLKYNKYFKSKIHTIYNGCILDKNLINQDIKKSILNMKLDDSIILCSYSTITRDKGLQQVIRALKFLPNYKFIIIGEGPYLSDLKHLTSQESLEERVLFLPYMFSPYSYLQYVDLYMMTSYSEGFGLSMVEAALKKKSIVCSDIPIFRELFSDSEVTFFDLDQIPSLVIAIKHAYVRRDEKSVLAFQKANNHYTAKTMAENHYLLYSKILKQNL